ncbi:MULTISPECIES: GNAT family N-acetyltransferase [Mumia]|uniref:GNAT family N-acetyltransferase n=1 Tax=Mumia TaxID=1546255 RepID=UPI001421CDC5|nr:MULTISPECIES: GNAT family N-acetyltransferase [unclassified Mumia]QMW66017.1 GNAT family N-acetyltransferase [Mumia sp. ZJ1417]
MIPSRAYVLDAAAIVSLRDALARWQASAGIDQWQPGEVDVPTVRDQIAAGQWWVLRDDGALNATVRILEDDPEIWDDLVAPGSGDALYVHGLMVRRLHRGRGLGVVLLEWAEARAREAGRAYLRLDTAAANAALRTYYRDRGFVERGERAFEEPWGTLVRLEKALA